MIPGVIANFVAMLRDRLRAIHISLGPVPGNEERAVHTRAFQRADQVLKALRIRSGIERDRDLALAAHPAHHLAHGCHDAGHDLSAAFIALRSSGLQERGSAKENQQGGPTEDEFSAVLHRSRFHDLSLSAWHNCDRRSLRFTVQKLRGQGSEWQRRLAETKTQRSLSGGSGSRELG